RPSSSSSFPSDLIHEGIVRDGTGEGHLAEIKAAGGKLLLTRDQLGAAPLYFGKNADGILCAASEVKALQEVSLQIDELLPGHRYDGQHLETYFELQKQAPLNESPENIAGELHRRLSAAVEKRIKMEEIGSWLSGGLDSSTLAALVRPHVRIFHTFAAGLSGAPDLEFAREAAGFIKAKHHETIININEMLKVLPNVIYHLESFDALLVRSSITNYLVGKMASDYVPEVFSGEGGDELFAGYEYLKSLDISLLADELIDITSRLHNTALQRVDRCASAHGTVAHTAFLDPGVVDFAHRIPVDYRLHHGIEKWILRRAIEGKLPERVLNRTKAKFWEGAGVGEHLAQYAESHITMNDFNRERTLKNGWTLDSKEELMYHRIFREFFGNLENFAWMGRTKK
ncbi:MAG: asparagine synthase-related protein, partial [Acidobacteria bacterium]|nr:asparagine synthase-related protein [Acidobacteriota bacterium]